MLKILVATDGSRAGSAAVRFASSLLDGRKGELIVLTVYASAATGAVGANGLGPRREARKVLEIAARKMRRNGSPRARFELVRARTLDDVPEAISRQADRQRVDLVIVGSEGRESLTEWVVGGTALRLIYMARRPVTVVRAPRKRLPN